MTTWLSVSACNVTRYRLRELPGEIANTEGMMQGMAHALSSKRVQPCLWPPATRVWDLGQLANHPGVVYPWS